MQTLKWPNICVDPFVHVDYCKKGTKWSCAMYITCITSSRLPKLSRLHQFSPSPFVLLISYRASGGFQLAAAAAAAGYSLHRFVPCTFESRGPSGPISALRRYDATLPLHRNRIYARFSPTLHPATPLTICRSSSSSRGLILNWTRQPTYHTVPFVRWPRYGCTKYGKLCCTITNGLSSSITGQNKTNKKSGKIMETSPFSCCYLRSIPHSWS